MVVSESKIANREVTAKTAKSTPFGAEVPVSQDIASLAGIVSKSSVAVAVSELNAALEVFKQARPYGFLLSGTKPIKLGEKIKAGLNLAPVRKV
jgi:hypothetical protein